MTAHNDKVESVAEAIARARVRSLEEAFPCYWEPEAQAVLTLMEEKNWLKADASRSGSSPEAAGRERVECPECGGLGVIEGMEPDCCGSFSPSGECRGHCAVPIQTQEPCGFCGGSGAVETEAARSDSEDTQQAEGAATPANQLQELIEAAEALDNRIVHYALSIDNLDIAESRELDAFRTALQNVKGAA